MKIKNALVGAGKFVNLVVVTTAGCAVGGKVFDTCMKNDVCGEWEEDLIVGTSAMVGTSYIVTNIILAAENAAYNGVRKAAGVISSKTKKNAECE